MRLTYAGVLVFILLATLPLELVLHTRVYARPRRLLLTLVPVALLFIGWDLLAVRAGHWDFDASHTLGLRMGPLPMEEVAFFAVIPVAAILTLEAVRRVTGWRVGDE